MYCAPQTSLRVLNIFIGLGLSALGIFLSPPSAARIPNIPCQLTSGLTLPALGVAIPAAQQVAKPCTNKRVLILSDATRNRPEFFDRNQAPKQFNCVLLLEGPAPQQPLAANDQVLYGTILRLLVQGGVPILDAQCDLTVAVAYRHTSVVPQISGPAYAQAILEANQDLVTKLQPHVNSETILIGHGQGAVQACQLIRGNNLSRRALPAFKLIGLGMMDLSILGTSPALLQPLGLTPQNLCPLSGVLGIKGKMIPVEYQINSQDEYYGPIPNSGNALGIATKITAQSLWGTDSLYGFATGNDDPLTTKVEGLNRTDSAYRQGFSYIFEHTDSCAPATASSEEINFNRYPLFCDQTRLLRQLKYFDYLAETPWPALHQNAHNWDFALVDGSICYEFQYRVLAENRIISNASIHPDGSIYVTSENDLTAAQIIEPTETEPFCHLYKVDQNSGQAVCASPNEIGSGVRGWGPLILRDGTVIVADLDTVYALRPDHSIKWQRPYIGVSRSATTTKEGKILIMTEGFQGLAPGYIYVIDPDDGKDLITPQTLQSLGEYSTFVDTTNTPAVDPTTGEIINSIDFLPDPITGKAQGAYLSFRFIPGANGRPGRLEKNWSFAIPGVSFSSPTIAVDGTLFAHDGVDTTHAISREGNLVWSYKVGNISAASHAYNPITGNIFIVTGRKDPQITGGTVGLFALNAQGTLLWSTQQRSPQDPLVFSTVPALTQNGYLYGVAIRANNQLAFVVLDQQTGALLSSVPVDSLSGGFTTFNDQGDAFVSDFLPQRDLFLESPTTLPPGSLVGLHKYRPQQCVSAKPILNKKLRSKKLPRHSADH